MNHLQAAISLLIDLSRPQSTVDVDPVVLPGIQQPTCLLPDTVLSSIVLTLQICTALYHKLLNCVRDCFDPSGVSTWLVSGCRQTAPCVTGAESVRRQRSLMSCACISTNIFIKLLNFFYSCSAKVISVVANHRPCLQLKPTALPALHQQPDITGRCERPTARHQLLTSTAPCHVLTRDHKVLSANYIFIYTWNEPYFAAAEHNTFRPILISHPIPLRVAG